MNGADIRDNRRDWDRFIRGLEQVANGPRSVVTGVQQGTTTPEGLSVADYATVNEFGAVIRRVSDAGPIRAIIIPSRPFMRMYFDKNEPKIWRFSENALTQAMLGRVSVRQAFTAIGLMTQNGVKAQIRRSGDFAPNSPYTIKQKGSARPLIDHAILLNNINFELRRD